MDWLDEKIEKVKFKITNLSLRKSIIFYMILFILIVITLTAITMAICNQWDKLLWTKYYEPNQMNHPLAYIYIYDNYSKLSHVDRMQVQIVDFIQTWSVFIYSITGILGFSYLFYKNKLKEPLRILERATEKIGNNNLNIEIKYNINDEMGNLCNSFDIMRKQLISNNQKMWDVMEEQRRLNAAFAHDLRTPLTVLRGYTDFLKQYVPKGKITEEKLVSTLSLLSNNLERLERYSNTMKEINSLDEIPIHQISTDKFKLHAKLEEMITVMDGSNGITIKSNLWEQSTDYLFLDESIVIEVVENLLSNALRYAKSTVEISFAIEEKSKLLLISVNDDGNGFSQKDLNMATKPYYKDDTVEKSYHFGIGLYICKMLCEKHGGSIALSNSVNGGAIVTASFLIIKK